MNEVMTGLNPSADDRLAADLGVRIVPDTQDEVPPVVLGNKGYETDASGLPIFLRAGVGNVSVPKHAIDLVLSRIFECIEQELHGTRTYFLDLATGRRSALWVCGLITDEQNKAIEAKIDAKRALVDQAREAGLVS